jgi:hypothetical protein
MPHSFASYSVFQASSCDTGCVLPDSTADGCSLFLKNSDRHVNEESEVRRTAPASTSGPHIPRMIHACW